jgi:cation diffusion facilitator family transporter
MSETSDLKDIRMTLILYAVIFSMKLVVYYVSGTLGMLAEALHTLSDIFVSGFLLIAILYSRKKADEIHMFGYGRAQNVAALVAATLFISFTSYKLYEEAIPRLFQTEEVAYTNLSWVLGTIILSMVIAAVPLIKLLRKKDKGAAAKAQMLELVNDELGLLTAFLGTLGIIFGYPIADPVAAIIVATLIAINAIGLFRENLSFLLGRSPDPEFLAEIMDLALSVPGVLGIHDLRAEYIGPDIVHADIHIEVRRGKSIEEANNITEEVLKMLHKSADRGYWSVHVDPAKLEQGVTMVN